MPDWYTVAVMRIASLPALRDVGDVLTDAYHPDDATAWQWVVTAPLSELLDWADWAMDTDRTRVAGRRGH